MLSPWELSLMPAKNASSSLLRQPIHISLQLEPQKALCRLCHRTPPLIVCFQAFCQAWQLSQYLAKTHLAELQTRTQHSSQLCACQRAQCSSQSCRAAR